MKRLSFIFALGILLTYTVLGFISYQYSLPLINAPHTLSTRNFYDYAGITHAHSRWSTGSGTIEEISMAANQAKCHFVIMTDLNLIEKPYAADNYKNDVLIITADKFSFGDGHLLVYNKKKPWPFNGLGQAQVFLNEEMQNQDHTDSLYIAAHPFLPRHQWGNLNLPRLDGMEVLNLDSLWNSKFTFHKMSVLWSFFLLPFNSDLSFLRLFSEPVHEINAWDAILQTQRKFIGMAGSGATAKAIPWPDQSFKFPSYTQLFKLMKNHVLLSSELTGKFSEDKNKILNALARGHFYFSLDILGDPSGFIFSATQKNHSYLMGDTIKSSSDPISFHIQLGQDINVPYEIVLYRNGEKVASSNSPKLDATFSEKGGYRVAVKIIPTLPPPDGKTWFTWIFSNPIFIQ